MWERKLHFEFNIFCKKSKCKNFVRTAQFSIIKFRMLSLKAAFCFEVCWPICESSLLWSLQWQCMHVPAPRERVKPCRDRGKPRCHFPERENQRTAEEGRWVQAPLRAASPTAGCSGPHPISFGVSPRIEIPRPLCQPVQCLIALAVRKVFLRFSFFLKGISCISVLAHCLLASYWALLRRVWVHLLYSCHQAFVDIGKIPWSLLFSWLNTHSLSSFSSYKGCSDHLLVFVVLCSTLSSMRCTGEPRVDPALWV